MKLHDASFLDFGGDPVTGRTPASVVVDGNDGVLTAQQEGGVAHAYKLFCDAKRTSLGDFQVQHRTLADGTTVAMTSINGVDQVRVTPSPRAPRAGLESLFIGVPASFGGHDFAGPRYSKQAPFRGKTAPPERMSPTRTLTDLSGVREHPGNLTWWSADLKANRRPIVVSWYGKATRYGRADYYGRGRQAASTVMQDFLYGKEEADARLHWDDAFKPRVWTNGVWHSVTKTVMGSPVDVPVMSAALKKETDGMYLWVVTHDAAQLAVYKGKIDPYRRKNVLVEFQFNINFQVVTTPASGSHPWWETPLQPFYFNASCTMCASLVAVDPGSATNTTAAAFATTTVGGSYSVVVAEVDLVLQTTTFSANHLTSSLGTVVSSSAGAAVDWHGYNLITPPPIGTTDTFSGGGTNTYTITEKEQRYGAVDYVADQLTIAIIEVQRDWGYVDIGAYTYSITNYLALGASSSGSLSRDFTKSITPGYRVFRYHDGHTLASYTGATVALDTVHVESTSLADAGTGTSSFIVSADIMLDASVEGGDLRHKTVVVSELVEIGTSNVVDAFLAAVAVGHWSADKFVAFSSDTFDLDIQHVYSSAVQGRRPARRLAVWKDGTAIETGTARNVYGVSPAVMTSNTVPLQYYGVGSTFDPFWFPIGAGGTVTSAGHDNLSDWLAFSSALSGYLLSSAMQGGIPYVNTCAFATDADTSQWFYNIAEYAADASESPATFNPKAAFVIAGTKFDAHVEHFYIGDGVSSYTDAILASPIYLDNVPT